MYKRTWLEGLINYRIQIKNLLCPLGKSLDFDVSHQDEDVLKVLESSLTTSVRPSGLPHSGMRELTPQGCPVTSVGKLWCVLAHTDSHSDS